MIAKTPQNCFLIILIAIVLSIFIFYYNDSGSTTNTSTNTTTPLNELMDYAKSTIELVGSRLVASDNGGDNVSGDDVADQFNDTRNYDYLDDDEKFVNDLFHKQLKHKKDIAIGANRIIGIGGHVSNMKNRVGHLNKVLENHLKTIRNKSVMYNTNGEVTRLD